MIRRARRRNRGRPTFRPTAAMRRLVSIAAAGGMSHDQIAIGMGVARNTLEKHFKHELARGALKRRVDVLVAMYRAAMGGNVAAQRAYLAAGDTARPVLPVPRDPTDSRGKKERAEADARTAQVGTDWEEDLKPPPGRKLQ